MDEEHCISKFLLARIIGDMDQSAFGNNTLDITKKLATKKFTIRTVCQDGEETTKTCTGISDLFPSDG
jgi:hypothetical protein